ncbi:hypothetical protein BV394_12710 [Brevirhabdus pacifica]|uniref:2-dehydropantoate 2-reductase n=1 Tax=Brevirhabdus pacifica TaxID=1267768 RepID=A0A1U7DKR2_9RHOB|nr:2-dehydropantoate 2-reductase [Brevirhabdus pacifica]APX90483.1 hypothetical protein BV394_12710 [Brevirhabdus pacifica]OWU78503.1 hypothetical protein ATO5_06755 [Loktanella sp. 22II-4b]PJJ85413.1 ketopantoate reductase [Brevirhabdus pacifica]
MDKRIAIIGAGAMGGYFGGQMAQAGMDVVMFDAWPEHVETVRRDGLSLEELDSDARAVVHPDIRHLSQVQELIREHPVDIAFIAVKSYDTRWATEMILPYMARDGAIVSLQNSFNEPEIAQIAGPSATFGCAIAALACDMIAPGRIKRMSPRGHVNVGAMDPARIGACDGIARALAHAEDVDVMQDLPGIKWSKLVVNSMRNGLSGMTGMTGLERDTTPVTIELGMRLGAQTVRVGRALDYGLVDTAYSFDALVAAEDGDTGAAAEIRAAMARIAGGRSADQRPSMAQDIRKGRRTETDAINGLVARRGQEMGIDCAPHEKVHRIIRRIERGELSPAPELAEGIL